MPGYYELHITDDQRDAIEACRLFFVATATPAGPINLSPRGHDCLGIVSERCLGWIDYPGSGNETARHLMESDRITLLFCDLEGEGRTIRVFGRGRVVSREHQDYGASLAMLGFEDDPIIRQVILVDVLFTSRSCGSGVPVFKFERQGNLVHKWHRVHERGKLGQAMKSFLDVPRPRDVEANPTRAE